jgi:hypothetical protein
MDPLVPDDATDISHLPEDERIRVIGEEAEAGHAVGFVVDTPRVARRYIKKLLARYRVRVIEQAAGTKREVVVQVGPTLH